MAITTYAELQSAITNWLGGRTDLTAYYPDWIKLFEAHAARRLRVEPMVASASVVTSSGTGTLPTDFLYMKSVLRDSDSAVLEYNPDPSNPAATGTATSYQIYGSTFIVNPIENTTFDISYYQRNTAVSSTLNWLFTGHPDAYLWGALVEGAAFMADPDNMLPLAKSRRDEIMQEVEKLYQFKKFPPGTAVRPSGATP